MPKISDAKRESRRQEILDAALRCFSRDGFHNTTTADIVRESRISQGALYLYFKTKDEIIVALADDRHQGDAYVNALAQSEPDPIQGLSLLLETYGRSLEDERRLDIRRVGVQGWGEALRNPTVHASAVQGMNAVHAAIIDLIERGQANGEFRHDAEPDAVARILMATFQGLNLQSCLGQSIDLHAIGKMLTAMLRGALSPGAANAAHPESLTTKE